MSEVGLHQWRRLRAHGSGDGVREIVTRSAGVDTGFGYARYALGPALEPRLLVPCGPGTRFGKLTSGENLVVTVSTLECPSATGVFIDVMVTNHGLERVFSELVAGILVRIREGESPEIAVSVTINEFRALLLDGSRQRVPDTLITGLAGELWLLKRLVDIDSDAVLAWTGPMGQRHDFRRQSRAIEVKTSGRSDAHELAINGIDQLCPPAGGTLLLAHLFMEYSDSGPLHVSGLFRAIVEAGGSRSALEGALLSAGCSDPDDSEWNRLTFSFEGLDLYRVERGFPRITSVEFAEAVTPRGVNRISYSIDLTEARDFRFSPEEIPATLGEFLG